MNRTDFYIMIFILYVGFCFIYTFHPKPISIIQYPSINKDKYVLKDSAGKKFNFVKKVIN